MDQKTFKRLEIGNVIRHAGSGRIYTIISTSGGYTYEAMNQIVLDQPAGWCIVTKGHDGQPETQTMRSIASLSVGMWVRSPWGNRYDVVAVSGSSATVERVIMVTNPTEWEI